jgi:hypothetical protein
MVTMTVFFHDPFWVAVLELHYHGHVKAVRHVFGAEPTDAELYEYLLRHGVALLVRAERGSVVTEGGPAPAAIRNPKRQAREAARAAALPRPSTAAQEAVRKDLELRKKAAAQGGRDRRDEHAEHRRESRRAKSRARHRGH